MGLTPRLLLLAFLALLPAIAIQAYNEFTLRRDREQEVREQSLDQARLAASEIDRILVGVQNLLIAVSKAPSIRALDAGGCIGYLASLQPEVPYLLSISALDRDGVVRCRQQAPPSNLRFSDRPYFQEALAGEPFVVGEYTFGRISQNAVLPLAIPLRAEGGQIIGVVAAALDLNWLTARLRERGYPEGGSITVADRNGVIIAREPFPERFIGTQIPEAFRYLVTAARPGAVEVTSQDGTRRILGYVPATLPPTGLYVSSGLASDQAFAAVNAATRRSALFIGAGLLLALAAAWLAGRIFIKRPVDRLLFAAEAWRSGDLTVRTGLRPRGGELSRIGAVFDRVAGEVQRRSDELKESEERSRLAIEATGIGIWDVDAIAGTRRWSPEFRAILGLPADAEADMLRFSELIHPDDRDWVNELYRRAYRPESGGRYEAEFRVRRADDGAERWVLTTGRVTFRADGAPLRGIGTIRDITERKQAEAALRESEARLRALADHLPNGMVYQILATSDGTRRFVYVSQGVERLIGPKAADILDDPSVLYGAIHEEDFERLTQAELRAVSTMSLFNVEVRMRRTDGELRWFQLASAPRALPDGSSVWDGVALDITERVKAEQELRQINDTLEMHVAERTEELAAANRQLVAQIDEREKVEKTLRQMQRLEAVGQLTSGVAHDFNNLLTVILGNLDFLARADIDAKGKRRIEMMRSAAERGAKLTDQLLAFSRRQRLEPRPLDLNETIAGLTDLLQSTIGGSVRLSVELSPALWPALVDPTQIELVILNLAINARDAMEVGGSLSVETANARIRDEPARPEEPAPGDYVMIAVRDTGTGMSEEVLAKVFEPFFTTKAVGKGSGLGLAQVYGFAKQSGGGVRIETRLGEGTIVKVFLPRAAAAGAVEPELPLSGPAPASPNRLTILLVDDDEAVREVTAGILADQGFDIIEAANGVAALEILREARAIDLLLVDFAMPGMNGADVARAARAERPGLPVLFVTGYADFAELKTIGEEHVVQKPYRGDELLAKMTAALSCAPRPASEDGKVVPLKR